MNTRSLETTDLGSLIRAKLTPAEIDRLQHFDKAALLALDRAIIELRTAYVRNEP